MIKHKIKLWINNFVSLNKLAIWETIKKDCILSNKDKKA